jgi:hypothetical protein
VQRLDILRRLTTDNIHMSARFHLSDVRQDRLAEVEGGISIGLGIHLADEEKPVGIFEFPQRGFHMQVHTVREHSHVVMPKNQAIFFGAYQDLGGAPA